MGEQFGEKYAKIYDKIYADKDYEGEVDFLEQIFGGKVKTVIDIGCGTGRHAEILKKRGYRVTGVEPSEAMAKIAKKRGIEVIKGKVTDFPVSGKKKHWDAAIAMFNVMGYIGPNRLEFIKTIEWVARHTDMFIFDFWNGKTVAEEGLSVTRRLFEGFTRIAAAGNIGIDNVVKMRITIQVPKERYYETHRIRFFYMDELFAILKNFWKSIEFYKAWEVKEAGERDFEVVCVCR